MEDRESFSGVNLACSAIIASLALPYSACAGWDAGCKPVTEGLMLRTASRRSDRPSGLYRNPMFGRSVDGLMSEPSAARNVDFLAWFNEDERQVCEACGERSVVGVPEAVASFCLNCGAVTIDGVRVDIDGRLPGLSDYGLRRLNLQQADEPGVLLHRLEIEHPSEPADNREGWHKQ
jgi:hypothetical protein